jgi:hypothetical protein
MQYVAVKNFLVRQVDGKHPKTQARIKKDVVAKKGEKIELSDEEAIKFWGGLDIPENEKKRLLRIAKADGYKRAI